MPKGSSSPPKTKPNQGKGQNKQNSEMQKYFLSLSKLPKKEQVNELQKEAFEDVCKKIGKGNITISQEPTNLTVLFQKQKQKEELRIKKEKQKEQLLEKKKQQFQQQIMRLDMREKKSIDESKIYSKQYSNPDLLKYKSNSVLTKEEHENLIAKIVQAQGIQNKKRKQYVQKLQQHWKEEQENEKKEGEERILQEREKRKKQIEKKLSIKKEMNEKLQNLQAKNNRQLEEIKNKKCLHDRLEAQYQSQVLLPSLEEKKKRLRQIRQISRGFNVQQLNQHQKQYLKKRNNSGYFSRYKIAQEWEYKPPEKTQKLNKILEEEITERKKKIGEKKRSVEEKKLRQENFVNHMKEKFPPKVDINLQKQIEERIEHSVTKKRQATADSRVIGINYLSEAKKMKKKLPESRPGTSQLNQAISREALKKRSYSNYLQIHQDDEYYQAKKRKRLENLLNSNQNKIEKAKKLEIETKRMSEEIARKNQLIKHQKNSNVEREAAQLLMTNLQAKMGLIDIYNQQS